MMQPGHENCVRYRIVRIILIALVGFVIGSANALASENVKVSVTTVATLLSHPWEEAQARVISINDALLSAEVSGIISRLLVDVGERVVKDQHLAAIDDWSHRLQSGQEEAGLEMLEGQLHLAQQQLNRVVTLQSNHQASRERLDNAQTDVRVLKARVQQQQKRLEEVRIRLAKTDVSAPFAGIVVERMGQWGAWVTPGTPVLRLVDTVHVELSAQVAGEAVARMQSARKWRFQHQDQWHDVTLKTVIPLESTTTGTREVRLLFTNAPPVPGSAGRLQWQDARPHLPAWILVKREGVLGVFTARDNKAVFLPLPQAIEGNRTPWPFADQSQTIIVNGRQSLKEGDALTISAADGLTP